eukprot:Gb_05213 [translate_table: standard]
MTSKPLPALTRELSSLQKRHYLSRLESLRDENSLEVDVKALDEPEDERSEQYTSPHGRQLTHSRKLLISCTGQCIPLHQKEGEEEPVQQPDFCPPRERRESDSGKWNVQERFLWLKSRRKHKIIKANEDVLATYHDSYLYGKVVPTIKVRAAIRGGKWSPLLVWLESLAALILVALYVGSTS